jgi:hypothetical protein
VRIGVRHFNTWLLHHDSIIDQDLFDMSFYFVLPDGNFESDGIYPVDIGQQIYQLINNGVSR